MKLVSAAACLLLTLGLSAQQEDYRISIDGRGWSPTPFSPGRSHSSVHDSWPSRVAQGDLVMIRGRWLSLPDPGELRFVVESGRVLLERGEEREVVSVDASELVAMDADARASLLGVTVRGWSDEIASALAELDPSVVLTVFPGAAVGESQAFPPLPSGIRHLAVMMWWGSPRAPEAPDAARPQRKSFRDWSAASRLTELRTLRLWARRSPAEVDLRPFTSSRGLRVLSLHEIRIADPEALRGFPELLRFEADYSPIGPVGSLEYLASATQLRHLVTKSSAAGSLAVLAKLEDLETIDLTHTAVDGIPADAFPNLRRLHVMGSLIPVEEFRAFRVAHPGCRTWGPADQEQLSDVLSSADRLVVRSGGCCSRCRLPESEEIRVEITDPVELRSAAQRIRIIEYGGWRTILTCGDPTLEFHAEGEMVASIGVYSASSIDWSRWSTVADLTPESSAAMSAWLSDLGF